VGRRKIGLIRRERVVDLRAHEIRLADPAPVRRCVPDPRVERQRERHAEELLVERDGRVARRREQQDSDAAPIGTPTSR
jgi:hypothetical protein